MEQAELRRKRGGFSVGKLVTLAGLAGIAGALGRSAWASVGGVETTGAPWLLTFGIVGSIVGVLLVWMDATEPAQK